ncbi:homocysteine S-methyltransferase [Leucobacter sp. gxy201]|uniref:homocysteine S-methyltransferase n=1 Tax=Leucobacter sp. gxy201 TaxID=2957200 RepID=UPI003DA18528
MPTLLEAIEAGPVVLDGGLGTHLEARGNSVASALWSAKILRDDPDEVRAAHRDFFESGARIATTCSYQVSYEGFASESRDEVNALLRRSVQLAGLARADAGLSPDEAWVAASVGPYGSSPGCGTEYDGDYGLSVAELRAWHRPRIDALAEAGADVLLFETVPLLDEVEAICAEMAGTGVSSMISVTVDSAGLRAGRSLEEFAALAEGVDEISAIGVNCSALPDADAALRALAGASAKPLLVYPNTGEVWNPETRSWSGSAERIDDYVDAWLSRGVALIGGCCRVTTTDIARLAERVAAAAR